MFIAPTIGFLWERAPFLSMQCVGGRDGEGLSFKGTAHFEQEPLQPPLLFCGWLTLGRLLKHHRYSPIQ